MIDEQYRAAVVESHDAIAFADGRGTLTFLNAAALVTFGYAEEEILGRPISTLMPERFRAPHADGWERFATTGETRILGKVVELVGLRKDRSEFPLELSLSTASARGEVFFAAVMRDVTERDRGPDAVVEAVMLRHIVAGANEGILMVDADSRTTFTNRRMEEMLGYEPGEMAGKCAFDFADAQERDGLDRRLEQRRRGIAEQYDVRLRRKDGADVWGLARVAPLLDDRGQYLGSLAMLTDITDRTKADQAVRRSEVNFRSLVERLPAPVFVNRDGVIIYVNPALVSWLGFDDSSQLVGRTVFDAFVHPDERERVLERMRHVRTGGKESPVFEVRWLRCDGSIRTVETMAVWIDFDGAPAHVVLARDVTDERAMQARLALSDRLASVGTLAAGVAHEVNNPLTCVMANLDALLAELRDGADLFPRRAAIEEMARDAREGAERVRRIVQDLKRLSRADEERRVALDVETVLETALRTSSNEIRHRARLVRQYQPVPMVVADAARLTPVFVNLLVNAAQAIPEGHADANEIRVTTKTDGDGYVVIEVQDSGRGIPGDVLHRVFDPFFTTKAVGEGMGLGLAICHTLVTSLGGHIVAESAPGGGTLMRVTLRPAPQGSTAEAGGAVGRPHVGRRGEVLLLDDDPAVARSLLRLLGGEHHVVHVSTGWDALARLRAGTDVDVILCDLMMPEMTGMEFYAELASTFPDLCERVVFMTGGAFTLAARAFLDEVPNACVDKPVDAGQLRALVRGLVR